MIGNEVRTKGKHQLVISCTQKKGNLSLSNTKKFYSFCEPWHTWWESVDTWLLIKCSTYKAMWQNVFCKFCLLKAAGQDIWSDCEDLFLFLLPWTERNCWQLLRGALAGAGCGMRNWSKGKKRERLSANTLVKKYIQAFWLNKPCCWKLWRGWIGKQQAALRLTEVQRGLLPNWSSFQPLWEDKWWRNQWTAQRVKQLWPAWHWQCTLIKVKVCFLFLWQN